MLRAPCGRCEGLSHELGVAPVVRGFRKSTNAPLRMFWINLFLIGPDCCRLLTALGVAYIVLLLLVLVYIKQRLGLLITGRTALLGWMWVICGPPHVYYWLAGKLSEAAFVRITLSFSLMWIAFIVSIEVLRLV